MRSLRSIVIIAITVPWALLGAQQPGAASVQGLVVTAGDNATPVPGATVEVRRLDGSAPQVYATTSANDGSFSIDGVRPGQYTVLVRRNGYLPTPYGQRRFDQPGVTLSLSSAQRLAELRVALTPAAVIHGRIYDREGEPVGAATVQAMSPGYQNGMRTLKLVRTAVSNDRGEYRLFDLPPGQYYISATPVMAASPVYVTRNTSSSLVPPDVARSEAARDLLMATTLGSLRSTRLPVYYPGTEDARQASPIELREGANYGGLDFLIAGRTERHVRGVVRGGRAVSLILAPLNLVPGSTQLQADLDAEAGAFDFDNVAPGEYLLVAKTNEARSQQILDVGDAGLNNVGIAFDSGIRIPGRVVFDDRAPDENDPDIDHLYFDLTMEPVVPGVPVDTYSPVKGGFTFGDLTPGDYRITNFTVRYPTPALRNAYLKSIRLGDQDVLRNGLRVSGPVAGTIEIVVGMRPATLEGTVVNAAGTPVGNATVVLTSDSAKRSRASLYHVATTDASGRFLLERLPPGTFKLFAWESIEPTAWQDPGYLALFEDRGQVVQIRESTRESARVVAFP